MAGGHKESTRLGEAVGHSPRSGTEARASGAGAALHTRALRTWQRALQRLPPAARQALHAVRRRVPVPPPPPLPVRRCAVRRGAGMAGRGGDPHRLRPPGRGGARRDLTAAHIESFNYAVSEGVYRAVQVWGPKRGG